MISCRETYENARERHKIFITFRKPVNMQMRNANRRVCTYDESYRFVDTRPSRFLFCGYIPFAIYDLIACQMIEHSRIFVLLLWTTIDGVHRFIIQYSIDTRLGDTLTDTRFRLRRFRMTDEQRNSLFVIVCSVLPSGETRCR